jgi:hypothetical protein
MKAKSFILLALLLFPGPSVLWAQGGCALNVVPGRTFVLSNTSVFYCSMSVAAGATLVIGGSVTINVTGNVDIEGTVEGIGQGCGSSYSPAPGPGAGATGSGNAGCGGGGHGGAGGSDGTGSFAGGSANDSPANPVLMGSAGGGPGGNGGAAFLLSAPSGTVTLNGLIDMSGMSAAFANVPPGGGAGGTIAITAQSIVFNGTLNAIGGNGGNGGMGLGCGGGGGGGGLILLCPSLNPVSGTGTYSVDGGKGGSPIFIQGAKGVPGSPGFYTACSPSAASLPNGVLYLSENLLQPSQGPVSIFWSTSLYPGHLKLRIYNTAGEWIQTLDDTQVSAPYQNSTLWSGTNSKGNSLASGVYFFLLTNATDTKTARLLLVR